MLIPIEAIIITELIKDKIFVLFMNVKMIINAKTAAHARRFNKAIDFVGMISPAFVNVRIVEIVP